MILATYKHYSMSDNLIIFNYKQGYRILFTSYTEMKRYWHSLTTGAPYHYNQEH